jgi:hypothetical protein
LQAHFVSPRCARPEGTGDQDHEPISKPTRFVILIFRALGTAGRTAGRHEYAARAPSLTL